VDPASLQCLHFAPLARGRCCGAFGVAHYASKTKSSRKEEEAD
jgi:hypothetical protein